MSGRPALTARSEPMHPQGGRIEGGSPLAGHLGMASLLVRESVQNSWDARDDDRGDAPVVFEIHGWDLSGEALDHLRALLPVDDLEGFERTSDVDDARGVLHPGAVLKRTSVEVLVISDRNTVGLCGPSRSGLEWIPVRHGRPLPRGQQRFANFVRNMGRATADTGDGDGGAYGIGKSALWMASDCGTALIHSRTTNERGDPVERFIAAVHGEHFYSGGREFTGRHFIGDAVSDELVEPLVGAAAAHAAHGLPLPTYEYDGRPTDGTSIVIVAPRLGLDWSIEMRRIRDAVRWHVWPKLVPGVRAPSAGADMEIRVGYNGAAVDLPAPLDDPEVRPYAKALLDCARDRRSDEDHRDFEARCGRPIKTLGAVKFRAGGVPDHNVFHVTLTESEIDDAVGDSAVAADAVDSEPAIDFDVPWGQIALVRREPLLLIRYEPIGGPDAASAEVGVFLSADDPEVEGALTAAEPPAHDDWIHKIVPKDHTRDHRRTFAKRTIEEIKSARSRFLAGFRTVESAHQGGGEQVVSRLISQGLLGGIGGRARPKERRPSGSVGASKPRAELAIVSSTQDGENTIHELDVTLLGLGPRPVNAVLTAGGSGYDNAGSMPVGDHVSFAWVAPDGKETLGESLALAASDDVWVSLIVTVRSSLRFRPRVSVQVDDAS